MALDVDQFTDWYQLQHRRRTAVLRRLCTCCIFIWRAGEPEPRMVPAVVKWICGNGNRELLCEQCLNYWRQNADEDHDLRPAGVVMLALDRSVTRH